MNCYIKRSYNVLSMYDSTFPTEWPCILRLTSSSQLSKSRWVAGENIFPWIDFPLSCSTYRWNSLSFRSMNFLKGFTFVFSLVGYIESSPQLESSILACNFWNFNSLLQYRTHIKIDILRSHSSDESDFWFCLFCKARIILNFESPTFFLIWDTASVHMHLGNSRGIR